MDEDDKVSKKRKRLACEESNSQPADKVVVEESKRQKTESSKESDGIKLLKEVKESLGSDLDKGDKGKVALNKSQETPIKQLDVQANGILDKNGEKSTERKQVKNQQNSTEVYMVWVLVKYIVALNRSIGGLFSNFKAEKIIFQFPRRHYIFELVPNFQSLSLFQRLD